ncbi:hypothetical protein L3V31_07360 [Vibrio sp. J1-1]|uniref:hypothetical protein n=1 Tax=Vibrio sp. J1-1 TaxID=2912251 RepID=UPI001F1950DA|nr:hypothetical protein [Vibrio sp. J1-1]MCF7481544.1 hypothetical protein [Vibrio sp. J1-1]
MRAVKIFIVILSIQCVYAVAGELKLPDCPNSPKLETEIYFYIDENVLDEYSKKFVDSKINTWVEYSNLTLENSCIPIKRKVTKVEYLSHIDSTWFQHVDVAKDLLKYHSAYEIPETNSSGVPIFKAILFSNAADSFKSQWCGVASASANYFVIGLNCYDSAMEHEIGHLSGANHDMKTVLENSPKFDVDSFVKNTFPHKNERYSFGATCSNRGTVMSYEKDIIPAYSSPDISVDGEVCGVQLSANNAQVLRNFAKKYASN